MSLNAATKNPSCLQPVLSSKRSHHNEKPVPSMKSSPYSQQVEMLDVIKDLEGRLSWIIWVGIKCNKCAHKRMAEGSLTEEEAV